MQWKKIILVVGLAAVAITAAIVFSSFRPSTNNLSLPPQFVQADFIDLDKIFAISKFRSGMGHDFSSGDEKCRSMKHYFTAQVTAEDLRRYETSGPASPEPATAINIYSPVDGKIVNVKEEESGNGKQIYIRPNQYSEYTIRLFHVHLTSGVANKSAVKAGQKIGEIGKGQTTDISVQTGGFGPGARFVSYFSVMPDDIFVKYQARGLKNRDELIVTKEYRDSHPFQCNGEQFAEQYSSNSDEADEIYLSGYTAPIY